jgi:transcriptional regulator with XRE-family HTH domain
MEPGDFKKWRKSLKYSQKEAAHALGLKRRMIQYYEKGERDGDKVAIPRSVRLACFALAEGVEDYHGPQRKIKRKEISAPSEPTPPEASDAGDDD